MKKISIVLITCIVIFGFIILNNKPVQEKLESPGENIIEIYMGDSDVFGDVNGNGRVDSFDYILVRKYLLGSDTLTEEQLHRADVDGNSGVTIGDYIIIRKILLGTYSAPANRNSNATSVKPTMIPVPHITSSPLPTVTPKATVKPTATPMVPEKPKNGAVTPKPTVKPVVKPTATATPKPLTAEEKICESVKNNSTIDYKSFASLKKDNDDYYVIKAAHDCANKYKKPIKVTNGEYNIYKKTTGTVTVKTNTDLGNSIIYIHDENGAAAAGAKYSQNIYTIAYDKCYTETTMKINNLKKGNTISSFAGSTNGRFVRVKDENKKIFIRSGMNNNSGDPTIDVFTVDKNGKVLDDIFWNYNNKNVKVLMCDIAKDKLYFKNATIYNVVDTNDLSKTSYYTSGKAGGYFQRGIEIRRSNVEVSNINHAYMTPSRSPVKKLTYAYYGIFKVSDAANVTIKDSKVFAYNCFKTSKTSTYDLTLSAVVNSTIKNVRMYDYDGTDAYFNKSSNQMKDDLWGVTQSGHSKNITFEKCVLNRIDAHAGIYNLTVKDSRLGRWGVNVVGFGTLNVIHSVVYYSNQFINLRSDYGSIWNGTVNISDSWMHPGNSNPVYLINYVLTFDSDGYIHNYGYDISLPNVNVNNFRVYTSTNNVYVFNNSESNTGKIKGNLSLASNYIKNNQFKFYYPKKANIKTTNIGNKNGNITPKNYYVNFGEN